MTINRLDGERVLVVLGDKDMTDFALDFKKMSLQNAHARKVLLRLTRLACRKSGIDTNGKRVNVEALTMGESCYLLVTVRRRMQRYRLKRSGGTGYRFESCGDFLNAVEVLYRHCPYAGKNAAYECGGSYYLLFDYPTAPSAVRRILREYAVQRGGALFCASVREKGRELCGGNAVAVIGEKLI